MRQVYVLQEFKTVFMYTCTCNSMLANGEHSKKQNSCLSVSLDVSEAGSVVLLTHFTPATHGSQLQQLAKLLIVPLMDMVTSFYQCYQCETIIYNWDSSTKQDINRITEQFCTTRCDHVTSVITWTLHIYYVYIYSHCPILLVWV